MNFTLERKKFLINFFFPRHIPSLGPVEAQEEYSKFCSQEQWEKRAEYFDNLSSDRQIQLFRILSQPERVELLKRCSENCIPAMCNTLSSGDRFALQLELRKAGAFII